MIQNQLSSNCGSTLYECVLCVFRCLFFNLFVVQRYSEKRTVRRVDQLNYSGDNLYSRTCIVGSLIPIQ